MANMQLPLRSPGSVSGSSVSSRSSQMSEVSGDLEVMLEQHIKLDALQRERSEANDLLADKEAECDTLAEKLDQRNKAYDELTRECVDLKTELVEKLRECFELRSDLNEKENKIYQLQKELDEKEKEKDELQVKLDKQRKEYDQLRADSDEREDAQSMEVERLNGLVCEAEEKLSEVTAAKEKECRKRGNVKRKAKQLAAELAKVESELAKVKSGAKTQGEELEAAKLKESTETDNLKKASQEIEKQKELLKFVLEREKNSLEQKDKERKSEVGQLNAQLVNLRKENSDMKKRKETMQKKVEDTVRKVKEWFVANDGVNFKNKILELETSLKKVTADLTTSQKSEKDQRDKLNTLQKSEIDLRGKLSTLQKSELDLRGKLSTLQKSERDQRDKLSALQKIESTLQKSEKDLRDKLSTLQKSEKELRDKLSTLQKSETDLRDKLSTLAVGTNTTIEQLGEQLDERTKEVARLKEELGDVAAEEQQQQPPVFGLLEAAQNQKLLQKINQMDGAMGEKDKHMKNEKRRNTCLQKKVFDLELELKLCQGQGQIVALASGSGKRPTGGQSEVGDTEKEGVGVAACRFEPARKKKRVSDQGQGATRSS